MKEMEMIRKMEEFADKTLELKAYEEKEYVKAFAEGTDKAWRAYRRNVTRRARAIEKEYEMFIDLDAIFA